MVKALSDVLGPDCCCPPPPPVLDECPEDDELPMCGISKTMIMTGLRIRFEAPGLFCEREWSITITQLDLAAVGPTWRAVPFPQGPGCFHIGSANVTVVDFDGPIVCEGFAGPLCQGCDPATCFLFSTMAAASVTCTDHAGGIPGDGNFIWAATVAPRGGFTDLFRYGAVLNPCPVGFFSYDPFDIDPQIVGLFPFSNPGVTNPGNLAFF